jgi:Bacterial Ig-like domain
MVRVCAAALASIALAASVLAQPAALEVDFSEPGQAAADVRLDTRIRIHFSRDVSPASLKDRVRVTYSQADSRERGEGEPPRVRFATDYDGDKRILEIRPSQRLERFRQVTVELLEGIVGADGSALKPWTLNFTTGGS